VLDREIAVGHVVVPIRRRARRGDFLPLSAAFREVAASAKARPPSSGCCRRAMCPMWLGKTWTTTDAIFRETPGKVQMRRAEGCLTVEMEAAAFFAVAQFAASSLHNYSTAAMMSAATCGTTAAGARATPFARSSFGSPRRRACCCDCGFSQRVCHSTAVQRFFVSPEAFERQTGSSHRPPGASGARRVLRMRLGERAVLAGRPRLGVRWSPDRSQRSRRALSGVCGAGGRTASRARRSRCSRRC